MEKEQDNNQQHENDQAKTRIKKSFEKQHKTIIKRRWESSRKKDD